MHAEGLIEELGRRREERLLRGNSGWLRRNPIASDLHPCRRNLALQVLAQDVRPAFDAESLERMEHGNESELIACKQLREEGWQIIRQQERVVIERDHKPVLTGKIDGVLIDPDGEHWPFDAKDVSWFGRRLRTEDDMRYDKWAYKWVRQANAYMLGLGFERFLFVISHRGERWYVPIELDYELAEEVLATCEQAIDAIDLLCDVPPDRLDAELTEVGLPHIDDPITCRACLFFGRVCLPAIEQPGVTAVVEDELAPVVERHQELADAAREYGQLDRELKKRTRGRNVLAGDYLITGEWRTTRYKAQPAKPAREDQRWVSEIKNTKSES